MEKDSVPVVSNVRKQWYATLIGLLLTSCSIRKISNKKKSIFILANCIVLSHGFTIGMIGFKINGDDQIMLNRMLNFRMVFACFTYFAFGTHATTCTFNK